MGRSWKDVKADKEAIDRAAGRDVEAARAQARSRTQAYVLGLPPGRTAQEDIGGEDVNIATSQVA